MVRPKKFKGGYSTWTLMRLNDAEEVYEKAEELAEREGISTSEFVLKALAKEVKLKIDGNPQIPLLPSTSIINDYRNDLAKRRLDAYLVWVAKYPTSPIKAEEFERVFSYVSKVRVLRADVEELLARAIGVVGGGRGVDT